MPQLFDEDGTEWPLGTISKTWATNFDDATIPGWLTPTGTIAASTDSPQGGTSGLGGVTLTGNPRGLAADPVDTSDPWLAAIAITATYTPGTMQGWIRLGCFDTTWRGGGSQQNGGTAPAFLTAIDEAGAATNSAADHSLRVQTGIRLTTTVRATFHDWNGRAMGGIGIWQNGGLFQYQDFGDNLFLGALAPQIAWGNATATEHIHQLSITKWWL